MAVLNELERKAAAKPPTAAAAAEDPNRGAAERERLRLMMLIRQFEERCYREYQTPTTGLYGEKILQIGGFCHLYSGQEAVAVGIASIFQKGKDFLINGYRDHGHSIALGMELRPAMAELFGRVGGSSRGKGGSMHYFQAEVGNLGGHGIVGGHIPLGAGAGFSAKYKKTGGVSFTLFGDGAINQGTFNETLNLASLWKIPVIFIVENNGMAMGTQVERASAEKNLVNRGLGFNMPCEAMDGNDVDAVIATMTKAADRARRGEGPTYVVANTYRFRGHSMSDAMVYRPKEEAERARLRDPITMYESRLRERGLVDDAWLEQAANTIREAVEDAVKFAQNSPHPEPQAMYEDTLAEKYPLQK